MKKVIFTVVIILAAFGVLVYKYSGNSTTTYVNKGQQKINTTTPMTITSPVFLDNQLMPKKYTCDGDGVNPPLQFGSIPGEAKSLALLVEDPDAPAGTWIHWIVWNIPVSTNQIAENSVPAGAVQGQGSSGQNVFGSPCPPNGAHHYIFTIYALDSQLSLPSYSTVENFKVSTQGHIIAQAQLVGIYGR